MEYKSVIKDIFLFILSTTVITTVLAGWVIPMLMNFAGERLGMLMGVIAIQVGSAIVIVSEIKKISNCLKDKR